MVMNLADAQIRIPHNDVHGQDIFRAIREGMWPFKPYTIDVWMDFDLDCNVYVVNAVARFRNGAELPYSSLVNAFDLAWHPERETLRVSRAMLKGFRNRPDIAPGPHIILGEN